MTARTAPAAAEARCLRNDAAPASVPATSKAAARPQPARKIPLPPLLSDHKLRLAECDCPPFDLDDVREAA